MKRIEILNKLGARELSKRKAYRALYPKRRKPRRAHFVKVKLAIPDEKGVSRLLAVLLFFPIPLFLVQWIMRRAIKEKQLARSGLTQADVLELVSIAGVRVFIHAKDGTRVAFRTI
ncbi:MAG: hypothetical protein ACLFSU_02260 [Acholeplasmataceae bacterium]